MSALLSAGNRRGHRPRRPRTRCAPGGRSPDVAAEPTHPHFADDDAHDQTSATRSGIVDAGRFRPAPSSPDATASSPCSAAAAWAKSTAPTTSPSNQSVALKFLPELSATTPSALERFHNEVRIARQVSHPNVCRVYDVGEAEGMQFISMEYVDGEDLASLLRRIGRLPADKALEIARQLCAGLAAAHDKGVIHRDLKPANVMLDGRGTCASPISAWPRLADQLRRRRSAQRHARLHGARATCRRTRSPSASDIYALGLVLYEIFTGKRALPAPKASATIKPPFLRRTHAPQPDHRRHRPHRRSRHPQVPRKGPQGPPRQRHGGLGGAARAATRSRNPRGGRNPVAGGGRRRRRSRAMKPRLAWMLLLTALACLIGFVYAAPDVFVVQRAVRDRRSDPTSLANTAQDILDKIGYAGALRNANLARSAIRPGGSNLTTPITTTCSNIKPARTVCGGSGAPLRARLLLVSPESRTPGSAAPRRRRVRARPAPRRPGHGDGPPGPSGPPRPPRSRSHHPPGIVENPLRTAAEVAATAPASAAAIPHWAAPLLEAAGLNAHARWPHPRRSPGRPPRLRGHPRRLDGPLH